jgi:hypothetical protein
VLDQDQKGKLDPCSNKYQFVGFTNNTYAIYYYNPENESIAKFQNVIFPHITPPNTKIPISSLSEGETQPGNKELDVEKQADQMPGNSDEAGPAEAQDNSSLNHKEFPGIHTRSQLKKNQTPLVQIRTDHGPVRM